MGAYVPRWCTITGEPASPSFRPNATLVVDADPVGGRKTRARSFLICAPGGADKGYDLTGTVVKSQLKRQS